MSGICIEKLSHSCGSSDGLQVFADEDTGKVSGYCFACSTYVPNPYGEEKYLDEVPVPDRNMEVEHVAEIACSFS